MLFSKTKEKKKFIYPAAIEAFLMLEDSATAKQYNDYAAAQKSAAEKLMREKLALQIPAEMPKKTTKKTAKKTVKKPKIS